MKNRKQLSITFAAAALLHGLFLFLLNGSALPHQLGSLSNERTKKWDKETSAEVRQNFLEEVFTSTKPEKNPSPVPSEISALPLPQNEESEPPRFLFDPLPSHTENTKHDPSLYDSFAKSNLLSEELFQTTAQIPLATELNGEWATSGGAIASSDDFNLTIDVAPAAQGGYYFTLTLLPKKGVSLARIRQNIYFLLDRSHSISRERYELSKKALIESLSLLRPEDRVNVLIFDNTLVKLSEELLPCNEETNAKITAFLDAQPYGGFFATTDLYGSLDRILPHEVAQEEVNVAILLSDGDTFMSSKDQREALKNWSENNCGKVSLFSLAVGKHNNLALLEILSLNNKGALIYGTSEKELTPLLKQLLQALRNPIGKDISVTMLPVNVESQIALYPRPQRLPNLYGQLPYKLYGYMETLGDCFLFIQGSFYDRRFDIKQNVSFSKAKKKELAEMERIWTIHQAYDCYDRFLNRGTGAIYQAKKLLKPYNLPVAFQ